LTGSVIVATVSAATANGDAVTATNVAKATVLNAFIFHTPVHRRASGGMHGAHYASGVAMFERLPDMMFSLS
jgi:hypothetical protein